MIEIIGTKLFQWDTGRSVRFIDSEADHAHFANKGDLKAVVMEIVASQAKIPDYLFQTGKQLCVYAVKDGVTVESRTFFVTPREKPEYYVYEDDQRNYIYEVIREAKSATEEARDAADRALEAAEQANVAADNIPKELQNATNEIIDQMKFRTLYATDDGVGNVEVTTIGVFIISDDGQGNVVIT